MAFIKEKIDEKKIPKKVVSKIQVESSFNKRLREGREQDKKEIEDKKQKELARIAEEKRMDKLIIPYLDNLQEQLVEKNLLHFWTFPDESGFIKYKNIKFKDIQKFINKDIDKNINRNIASISILFYHNDNPTSMYRLENIYMKVSIAVFPIDNDGIFNGKNKAWGADFIWYQDDFKITKFSFKLTKVILNPVGNGKRYPSILGIPLTYIVNDLKKMSIDFGDTLAPLAGS